MAVRTWLAWTIVIATMAPSIARADGPEQHAGFYLRMHLGPAFSSVKDNLDPETTVSGGGADLGVALGGCPIENLALFGELALTSAPDPTFEQSGFELQADGLSSVVAGFGPGVAYYLTPSNVYLSGTLMFATFELQSDDDFVCDNFGESAPCTLYESDRGPGLSLQAGKEWFVSDNWGIGVAARLFGGTATDKRDEDIKFTMNSISVLFSATYN